MIALVIGGTSGFGGEVSDSLTSNNYRIITISRSLSKNYANHYQCDVGDLKKLEVTLEKIKFDSQEIDLLACIAGFARAKPAIDLTQQDWDETLNKNIRYVNLAFNSLTKTLLNSSLPIAITIGSQWSYKEGCDELSPYITAKHALRALTLSRAQEHPSIKTNHYCVPTMNTPGYWEVKRSFQNAKKEDTIKSFSQNGLADPKVIATSLVNHVLNYNKSGQTLQIRSNGIIQEIV